MGVVLREISDAKTVRKKKCYIHPKNIYMLKREREREKSSDCLFVRPSFRYIAAVTHVLCPLE